MKLWGAAMSPNTAKVRIAAIELGLDLELVLLDVMKGEHRSPRYLALNPMGKLPTLEDDGFVLWESGAILGYLADRNPAAGLIPSDVRSRAEVTRWLLFGANHISPFSTTLMVERVIKPRLGQVGNDEHRIAFANEELARFIPILDRHLATHEYLIDTYSIADIALGMTFTLAVPMNLSLSNYPNIERWAGRLLARDAWKAVLSANP